MATLPISQFSELSGFTRETCAKRFAAAGLEATPGPMNSKLFESQAALKALYEIPQGGEQGALMAARVRNLDIDSELKLLKKRRETGDLIPALIVERVWSGMTNAARNRLLALPYRLACNCENSPFAAIQTRATELIYEALDQIHNYNPGDYLDQAPLLPDESAE